MNERPKTAIDRTEQLVRAADKRILHRKSIQTPVKFQKSSKKNLSLNKHQLKGPGLMFVGASEKAQKLQECFTSESKLKIGKVESDDKDCDSECCDNYDGKLVN